MATCESPVKPVVHQYHRARKAIHLACFLIFAALPFFNLMRFDIPRQRFYVFGFELWISEFGIIFFSLMFLMFVIIGSSVLYGRVYCGYLCPQMIFSEASLAAENWLARKVTKHFGAVSVPNRKRVARVLFYVVLAVASVVPAFVFISYFVEPRDLLGRLFSLDIRTAGGIAGAVVTLITFLDFTLVRQRFCTTVCPYGYLQGMLGDKNTLLVHYRDPGGDCIQCTKCVRVCHMGIDIRDSPFQIECVHCGECIDACDQVLSRLGKPGLIHYAWGEGGNIIETEKSWFRKLGMRDAKRVVVALVTLFYLSGLLTALSMRRAVLVQLAPERATLYRMGDDGMVYNRFRVKVSNRSGQAAAVTFSLDGLPGARLEFEANPVVVGPAGTTDRHFEVAAGKFPGSQEVNHFRITAKAAPGSEQDSFDETFLMPPERK